MSLFFFCDYRTCDLIFLQWRTWPEVFDQSKEGAGPYTISYLFYTAWALLFAALSASLVRMFAPYACGSGIPEVNNSLTCYTYISLFYIFFYILH